MVEKLEAQDDTLETQGLETARLTKGTPQVSHLLVLQRRAGPPLSACRGRERHVPVVEKVQYPTEVAEAREGTQTAKTPDV